MTPLPIERLERLLKFWRTLADGPIDSAGITVDAATDLARDTATALDMARSAVWRTDMENAPRDGVPVDIWIVPPSRIESPSPYRNTYAAEEAPNGYRVPDAVFANCGASTWVDSASKYATGRWYYDSKGDERLDPNDTSEFAFRAVAWRLPPSPPEPSP